MIAHRPRRIVSQANDAGLHEEAATALRIACRWRRRGGRRTRSVTSLSSTGWMKRRWGLCRRTAHPREERSDVYMSCVGYDVFRRPGGEWFICLFLAVRDTMIGSDIVLVFSCIYTRASAYRNTFSGSYSLFSSASVSYPSKRMSRVLIAPSHGANGKYVPGKILAGSVLRKAS